MPALAQRAPFLSSGGYICGHRGAPTHYSCLTHPANFQAVMASQAPFLSSAPLAGRVHLWPCGRYFIRVYVVVGQAKRRTGGSR